MNYEREIMKSILISVSFFLLFCTSVLADTAHINYVSSTSDQYTQLKSELEDLGYTVTGTNSGSVTLSDFSSKDLHINIAGDSNCGSSCKTAYETYIGNCGNVIIAGNGVYNNNRTGSIEALIESKLSVGQITLLSYNANFVSYANGSYSGDATSGYWVTKNLFSMQSGGTALGSNNSTGTHAQKSWAKYDYGSNGGNVIIAGNGVYNNNRTGSIEALIESKLSVGQITLLSYNANFVSYANGSYSGDATSGLSLIHI